MDQQAGTIGATAHAAPVPRVGVGVLLVHDQHAFAQPPHSSSRGRALEHRRRKLDYLESLEQCAIREAREELGVDVAIQSLLCVREHRLPDEHQDWILPRSSLKSSAVAIVLRAAQNERCLLVPAR